MTKQLLIGLATIAVTGTALLATGMSAASTDTTAISSTMAMRYLNNPQKDQDIISTLSGKVSAPALQELQTLITKHKAEMDTLMTAMPIDKTAMQTKHEAFKTEMEALMVKYPELKVAMPQKEFRNKKGGKNDEIKAIIATLPANVQTELQAIRDSYKTKQEALRTEEKAKIDTLLSAYPEVKTKLETSKLEWEKYKMKSHKWHR